MKFSLAWTFLLVSSIVVHTAAMPAYYADEDVEVRSPPELQNEARQLQAVAEIGKMIFNVVGSIKAGIAEDKKKRGQFTSDLVGQLSAKNPKMNYVVCHTKHTKAFDGKEGTDWGHSHQEFDVKVGGTIGYEIYWFKSGKFTRKGDGGYLNWAYSGNVKSKSKNGKELVFGPR